MRAFLRSVLNAKRLVTKTLNNREHLVVPVTLIVSGTLEGSRGPLYYPPDEIRDSTDAWNGMPLVLDHPVNNGLNLSGRHPKVIEKYGLGTVFNVFYDEERNSLRGEAWFDVIATQKNAPTLLPLLKSGSRVEVSTGLGTRNYRADNDARDPKGRPYTHTAREYKPDHLAVLVDKRGACSVADGCGIHNSKTEYVVDNWCNQYGGTTCKKKSKNTNWAKKVAKRQKAEQLKGPPVTGFFAHGKGKSQVKSFLDKVKKPSGPTLNSENDVIRNCGGKGGKPGPCARGGGPKKKAPAAEVHRFESDDEGGGTSRLVVKKEKGAWVSTHYQKGAGEEGWTRTEGFHLGSARKMTTEQAIKKAKLEFGRVDREIKDQTANFLTVNSYQERPLKRSQAIRYLTSNCACWKGKDKASVLNTLSSEQILDLYKTAKEREVLSGIVSNSRAELGLTEDEDLVESLKAVANKMGGKSKGGDCKDTEETVKPIPKKKVANSNGEEQTMEEWLAAMPKGAKKVWNTAVAIEKRERDTLVQQIVNSLPKSVDRKKAIAKYSEWNVEDLVERAAEIPQVVNTKAKQVQDDDDEEVLGSNRISNFFGAAGARNKVVNSDDLEDLEQTDNASDDDGPLMIPVINHNELAYKRSTNGKQHAE